LYWKKNEKSGVPFEQSKQKPEILMLSYVKMHVSKIMSGQPSKVLKKAARK
jgi:hypothetical protein